MRGRIPPLFALLLLAVLVLQSVHLGLFEVRRHLVRKEMKQRIRLGLPQHELVRFSFSQQAYEALEKEDGGRELWVDGHIYDVVRSMTDADGTMHIEAVDDREEARLMAGLKELVKQGMDQRGMDRGKARQLLALLAAGMPERAMQLVAFSPGSDQARRTIAAAPLEGIVDGLLRPPRM